MADHGARGRSAPPLIVSESMVGERDPDAGGWSARDWVPGPAGTVGVTLPGGVELDVDVATPDTFVGLWVDESGDRSGGGRSGRPSGQPGDEAMRTLVALLGADRVDALLSLTPGGPRQLPGDELARRRDRPTQFSAPGPGVSPALAHHALAIDQASSLGGSDLVRALALIDGAAAALDVRGLDLDDRVGPAATEGVTALADLWPDVDDVRVDRRRLLSLLDQVGGHVDDAAQPALRQTMALLVGEEGGLTPVATGEPAAARLAAPMASRARMFDAAAPAPVSRLLDVDVSTLAESYRVTAAAARATTESEIEVRLPDRDDLAERLWARAHDRDGTVLAASRFVTAGDDAVARLLVPPSALTRVAVDITDRPADPLPSTRLRAMLEAIDRGRAAARSDRLDDRKEQFTRWSQSSSAWRAAGDDDRARRAMQFAEDGSGGRRVPRPLLADPVIEAGG